MKFEYNPNEPAARDRFSLRDELIEDEETKCELCKRAPRRRPESLLCNDCADAVGRVMSCEIYEADHYRDRQIQLAQVRLLVNAAKI
ncbi:MAG TPA: hypothetical protein VK699_14730 [Terriglobales bacterium]|jgi:hypothetical protein|nr:hypothetical protein [Terriglobales bacterium]